VSDRRSGWTIERILIERHYGGYGVIDILCSGTTVRANTMLNSPGGRFDLRRGSYSVLAGNWIEGAGGSVIHGGYQQVLGNHLERLTDGGYPDLPVNLVLTAGTIPWDYTGPPRLPDGKPVHQAAYHVLVAGNTAPRLEIGLQRSPAFTFPVRDTVVEKHTGVIVRGFQQETTVLTQAAMTIPAAVRLDRASVGPKAGLGKQDDALPTADARSDTSPPSACTKSMDQSS
jgi:hypothetical protein